MKRRNFATAALAAAFGAPALVRGRNLNSKVQLAAVGCEGKGWSDIENMASHPDAVYVGLCDVDLARMDRARHTHKGSRWFQDYRFMLDQMDGNIDAVTVSTADHMHASVSLAAMRRGLHVHCQKPLAHDLWETRQMTLQAARSGVITRMGNQIHSSAFYRSAVRWIQDGLIGKVKSVHSWAAATGHGKSFHLNRPVEQPIPESLDWNLWLGVAPFRPFGGHRVYHPWGWRDWQDFGNGALGDFGCHILDPVFTALEIDQAPTRLQAEHSGMNDEVWPAQTTVHYTFPGTAHTSGPDLEVTWYDGGLLPPLQGTALPPFEGLHRSGSLFVGETGTLHVPHVAPPRLYRAGKLDPSTPPAIDQQNHYHGWLDGILSGTQPSDGFAYAGPLTEAVLLGNVAVRFRGTSLTWDAPTMKITNHDEANAWIRHQTRPGWEIAPVV